MVIVDGNKIPWEKLPGRDLKWLVTKDNTPAKNLTSCLITISPGYTVQPAHSHPEGEEIVYIIDGIGKAYIDGVIHPIHGGCMVVFPEGQPHMLRNTGTEEMHAVCFFAPAAELADYKFFPDIDFDSGKEA